MTQPHRNALLDEVLQLQSNFFNFEIAEIFSACAIKKVISGSRIVRRVAAVRLA